MDLDKYIPFKYKSIKCEAPSLKDAQDANHKIHKLIEKFVKSLRKSDKVLSPSSIREYNKNAKKASMISEHFPSNIKDLIPLKSDRCSETILKELSHVNTPIAKKVLDIHSKYYKQDKSNLIASHKTMECLFTDFHDLFFNNKVKAKKKEIAYDIDVTDIHFLNNYQHIQERFENLEQIKKINKYLKDNPSIILLILSIQNKICGYLRNNISEHYEFITSPVGFQEIAI